MSLTAAGEPTRRLLFRVADVFSIPGRGVVIAGDVVDWPADFRLRVGDPLELARADGGRLRTSVRGIEMFSPFNPSRPLAILLGPGVEKADVEVGAEVWRVELEPPVT